MKIAILGAGESGVGAALLAKAKGFEVFVSDKGPISDKYKAILQENRINYEENQHTEASILDADEIIKSPGIPNKTELILKLISLKKPIISEIEFAARFTKAKLIAITGSNGKTTTTLLTYHLLKSAGKKVGLAGNIGESFAKQVINDEFDYFVLELSSFQLDNMYDFHANIAILLNITPDHLDRYNYDFKLYSESKFRVLQNMTPNDTFICFQESEPIANYLIDNTLPPNLFPVSLEKTPQKGAFFDGKRMNFTGDFGDFAISVDGLPLRGKHNAINMMCAILAAKGSDIAIEQIELALKTFNNAPHRLEAVATIEGVDFVNDSKATNVDSVFYALGSFEKPIVLIIGGVDKGNDYSQIEDLVVRKVKGLVCMGVDNSKLIQYFEGKIDLILDTKSLAEALRMATGIASKGDVVLLSPACASFDLFKNYEDRGTKFREAVLALK
ncbi:MAG: UDP-N-acetylmuramoyl-L-alanine--D-glutamate ligase [Bacteroidota bacterium]